jgi:sugar phosphate permease
MRSASGMAHDRDRWLSKLSPFAATRAGEYDEAVPTSRSSGYHGWRIVAALAVTETVSFGILYYAFTVFVTPMQAALGWSTATITGAFSLSLVVSGVCAPLVGTWVDRHGARALMTAGSLLAGALLVAWSFVEAPWTLYAVFGLMGLATAAVLYEPAFAVVAVWFERRRSAALTVLTFVAGFASVIFIPLAAYLVESLGWRDALRTLAFVQVLVTVPLHAIVLRRRPEDVGQRVDGEPAGAPRRAPRRASLTPAAAFATPAFGRLTFAFAASMAVVLGLGVHMVPVLLRRGMDPLEAAAAAAAIGIMALPGRLIFTPLGAIWPRGLVTASIFVLQTLALLALLLVPGPVGVWSFVALYGAGFGAITPARAALVAETFGAAHYGAIAGRMTIYGTGARALAPVTVGVLVTATGGDQVALVGLAGLTLAAAVAVAGVGAGPASGTVR